MSTLFHSFCFAFLSFLCLFCFYFLYDLSSPLWCLTKIKQYLLHQSKEKIAKPTKQEKHSNNPFCVNLNIWYILHDYMR